MKTGRWGKGNAFDAFPLEGLIHVKLSFHWDWKGYEIAYLGRLVPREASTGVSGPHWTGHITVVLQICVPCPAQREAHSVG